MMGLHGLALQVASYGCLPVIFTAIAFAAARFAGLAGMFIGHLVNAAIIAWLDLQWISSAMAQWHGEAIEGPDMDVGFYSGVCTRVVLINTLLLPVSWWAFRLRRRHRRTAPTMKDAL